MSETFQRYSNTRYLGNWRMMITGLISGLWGGVNETSVARDARRETRDTRRVRDEDQVRVGGGVESLHTRAFARFKMAASIIREFYDSFTFTTDNGQGLCLFTMMLLYPVVRAYWKCHYNPMHPGARNGNVKKCQLMIIVVSALSFPRNCLMTDHLVYRRATQTTETIQ